MLIDAEDGVILYQNDASNRKMSPASMTKVMTAYVVFDALAKGEVTLNSEVFVSKKAWSMPGSRTFMKVGSKVQLEDVLKGLIVQSGNDASVAIAEAISGSEDQFVSRMNAMARTLNMTNTRFMNTSGLPNDAHVSTAADMLRVSRAMILDYPQYYGYHAIKDFEHAGIKQRNRNLLIGRDGIDGVKTGYTEVSGYGIIVSARNDVRRVIGIVNGLNSEIERADAASAVMKYGLRNFDRKEIYTQSSVVDAIPLLYGAEDLVELVPAKEISILSQKFCNNNCIGANVIIEVPKEVVAPVAAGDQIGRIIVKQEMLDGDEIAVPLLARQDVKKASFFRKLKQNLLMMFA